MKFEIINTQLHTGVQNEAGAAEVMDQETEKRVAEHLKTADYLLASDSRVAQFFGEVLTQRLSGDKAQVELALEAVRPLDIALNQRGDSLHLLAAVELDPDTRPEDFETFDQVIEDVATLFRTDSSEVRERATQSLLKVIADAEEAERNRPEAA